MIRLQGGDRTAFDEIVDTHGGALYGFFMKNTRDEYLAEDLTQETLLRVYNMFWDYLPVGRFKAWLFRIARNLLIDTVRRRSHDALVKAVKGKYEDDTELISTVAGEFLSPEQVADHSELASLLDGMLDLLPDEQKAAFILFHFVGLSLPEIAEVFETSLPTTKSRLRLAREKLSAWMMEKGIINPHEPEN